MNTLQDILTYIRRIIKTPSNNVITDNLLIDYVNRFCINDIPARLQLFDYKTKYRFQTQSGVDQYNMPLYSVQSETPEVPGSQDVSYYPVYQGFLGPAYINGVNVKFFTEEKYFFNSYPNIIQPLNVVGVGDNRAGPYQLTFPILPSNSNPVNAPYQYILRGHVDLTGVIANANTTNATVPMDPIFGATVNVGTPTDPNSGIPTTSIYPAVYFTSLDANGNSVVVQDSGQFLNDGSNKPNYGLLMSPGPAPYGATALSGGYSTTLNTINYMTGVANVTFPVAIPKGTNINAQCYYFNCGLPRAILYYNNTLVLRSPPSQQWLVELEAYLTPAAFFSQSQAIPFAYMAEYIARGAARKILSDTGDQEQLLFYEPFFKEQENLVHIRSERQFTSTRTQTIYSQGNNGGSNYGAYGNGGISL
jgi:hypothetical protein